MMRGALLPSGTHHLVYVYKPDSFRLGGLISCGTLAVVAVLSGLGLVRSRGRSVP
jgi:hypothetical protein